MLFGFRDFSQCKNRDCEKKEKQDVFAIEDKGETKFYCEKCIEKLKVEFTKAKPPSGLEIPPEAIWKDKKSGETAKT